MYKGRTVGLFVYKGVAFSIGTNINYICTLSVKLIYTIIIYIIYNMLHFENKAL